MPSLNQNLSSTGIGHASDVFLGAFGVALLGGITTLITVACLAV